MEADRLKIAAATALAVLDAWAQWEAGIIMDNKCWRSGMAAYPTITETHYDALVPGLQEQRNAAVKALREALEAK